MYKISAGVGHGERRITSFDSALCCAGVGNYNLVRLSSILPNGSKPSNTVGLELGSLLPIAYATETSRHGVISAAVCIGFPKVVDDKHCGIIMEYEGHMTASEAEKVVREMVEEGFAQRGWELDRMESACAEADCDEYDDGYTTAFACVAEWEE